MNYLESKKKVSEILANDSNFKEIVKNEMGNWTHFSTVQLQEVIDRYEKLPKVNKPTSPEIELGLAMVVDGLTIIVKDLIQKFTEEELKKKLLLKQENRY